MVSDVNLVWPHYLVNGHQHVVEEFPSQGSIPSAALLIHFQRLAAVSKTLQKYCHLYWVSVKVSGFLHSNAKWHYMNIDGYRKWNFEVHNREILGAPGTGVKRVCIWHEWVNRDDCLIHCSKVLHEQLLPTRFLNGEDGGVARELLLLLSLQSCPPLQPHRQQPTRLPRPWDSPGKNTGVGCHFLLQCRQVKSESEETQSCLTLHDRMDCSLPGSLVHGIFQARVLEWFAFSAKGTGLKNPCFRNFLTSGWIPFRASSFKRHCLFQRHLSQGLNLFFFF